MNVTIIKSSLNFTRNYTIPTERGRSKAQTLRSLLNDTE